LLTFWIQDAGYRVNNFVDADSALRALRRGEVFDLMIVDSSNVDDDGEFVTIARRQPHLSALPMIGIGTDALNVDCRNRADSGFNEYATKPMDLYELLM
jgi:CheY-like chemotaxis protein